MINNLKHFGISIKNYNFNPALCLTEQILTSAINNFWSDVFKPLILKSEKTHLLILVKVQFEDDSMGYRTLGDLRAANFNDKDLFITFLTGRLGFLSESYKVNPVKSLIFTYVVKDGEIADNTRKLLSSTTYSVTIHNYNNLQLPLSMNPQDYGEIFSEQYNKSTNTTNIAVSKDDDMILIKSTILDGGLMQNKVEIKGGSGIKWVDTEISQGLFKREIGKNKFTVENGIIILKEKVLPAKPFKKVNLEKNISKEDIFMTMDIETDVSQKDGKHYPYLICGYTEISNEQIDITSFADGPIRNEDTQTRLFNSFIEKMLKVKSVKYVYAHNLANFDGALMMKHLIRFKNSVFFENSTVIAEVEPLLFNGKLMSMKLKYKEICNVTKKEVKRTIIFKDSYLMLPLSLRKLAVAFDLPYAKLFFPFRYVFEALEKCHQQLLPISAVNLTSFPHQHYFDISHDDYVKIKNQHLQRSPSGEWEFILEAYLYCLNDCVVLYKILNKFNTLTFSEFKLNIHKSLTLPSLAMRIFKAHYLPKDTIYQILGKVESDIREAYTGGAVDVYIPHNGAFNNFFSQSRYKLYYYDCNSMYPAVMSMMPLPVGKPIAFEGDIRKVEADNAYGFFYCKISCPTHLHAPILQQRVKTESGIRTIAGVGTWEGWVFSEEMYNAERFGYTFEIIRGYKFNKKVIFKEYVEKMYELRKSYPKSHPLNLIAKLLMNSLYGKFGMKAESTVVEIYDKTNAHDLIYLNYKKDTLSERVQDFYPIDDRFIILLKNIHQFSYNEDLDLYHGIDVSIPIAAAVTGGGRIIMSYFKNNPEFNLYYSDTDSAIIDRPLSPFLIGPELGQFKLEYTIAMAFFAAPKVYGFITDNGEYVVKIKGVSPSYIHPQSSYHEYERLLVKDNHHEFTQEKWIKNYISGEVTIKDIAYNLQVTSNKREAFYKTLEDPNIDDFSHPDKYVEVYSGTKPYNYNDLINKKSSSQKVDE